jgi:hypothetical protein
MTRRKMLMKRSLNVSSDRKKMKGDVSWRKHDCGNNKS